jgi:hypothetical protein
MLAEKGRKAVFSKTSVEIVEVIATMACKNGVGNFIPQLVTFIAKKEMYIYFRICRRFSKFSLGSMTDSRWIKEKKAFVIWLRHFQADRIARFSLTWQWLP